MVIGTSKFSISLILRLFMSSSILVITFPDGPRVSLGYHYLVTPTIQLGNGYSNMTAVQLTGCPSKLSTPLQIPEVLFLKFSFVFIYCPNMKTSRLLLGYFVNKVID